MPVSPPMDVLTSEPPAVAARSGASSREFLVVWAMPTIAGRSIPASRCLYDNRSDDTSCQSFLARPETIVGYGLVAMPTAAVGGRGYLLTYGAYPLAPYCCRQDIYGRLWWPPLAFLPLVKR